MFRVNSYWAHLTITHCHTKFLERKIRYDTIQEFNVDSKAEYSALSSTRSQKKCKNKIKQTNASAIVEAFSPSDLQYCAMTSDIKLLIRRNTFSVFESVFSFVCICLFMFRQVMLYVYMQLNSSVAEYFGCIWRQSWAPCLNFVTVLLLEWCKI